MHRRKCTALARHVAPLAAALVVVGCRDSIGPARRGPGAPAFSSGGTHVTVTGVGAIGTGSATPGSDRQEFNFDVIDAPAGHLFFRDWGLVRPDRSVESLTVDHTTDPATAITSFTQTSGTCVTFGGTARLDSGELFTFTIEACDNGSPGSGTDHLAISVPAPAFYTRSGTLTEGEITLSGGTPPTATRLVFVGQPSTTTAGSPLSPAVQVAAQDDAGNTVTGFTGNVSVAIGTNPGGGTLSGTTSVAAVNGVATFANLSINKAGTGYTLQATASGLTGATSTSFNITPAAASVLAFTGQPSNTTAGATISPAVQVTARDAFGNTATAFTGTVSVAIGTNPGGGTLSGTTSVAAVNGVATFANLSINKAGSGYTLQATASGLTGATSTSFNITPGPATRLVFSIQPSNTLPLVTMPPVEAKALDANGNKATSFTGLVTIAIGRNGGLLWSGTLSGTKTVAAVTGYATFSNLSIDQPGTGYTLVVTSSGLTGAESASFDVLTPPLLGLP